MRKWRELLSQWHSVVSENQLPFDPHMKTALVLSLGYETSYFRSMFCQEVHLVYFARRIRHVFFYSRVERKRSCVVDNFCLPILIY